MTIRDYENRDLAGVAAVFTEAVHGLTAHRYDAAQRAAWAPRPPDLTVWARRMAGVRTLVAERDRVLIGFQSYQENGHIDFLYIRPDAVRRGVATALYRAAEERLAAAGVGVLFTEASLVAAPFFAKQGFHVVEAQEVERGGVRLRRYVMEKRLEDHGAAFPA